MHLYGRNWKRRELESHFSNLEQIGGIKRYSTLEGAENGVEQIQVRTGAGLTYYVSPSRGMDISRAEFCGLPISWQSPNGAVHPSFYDPYGDAWARTAVGGLLMTCGLTQVGAPCDDNGEKLGLHGRIHHTPATHVCAEGDWEDDEYGMKIRGKVTESGLFKENIQLTREIKSFIGSNKISITDEVRNLGYEPVPHMILYHFNFGFPLMSNKTHITFPSKKLVPRETDLPLEGYDTWIEPQSNFSERVYYHEDLSVTKNHDPEKEEAIVIINNPEFPYFNGQLRSINVKLSWSIKNLPNLTEWYMPGEGVNALGIEPSNCRVEGRVVERNRGSLVMLEPGQVLRYELELEIYS